MKVTLIIIQALLSISLLAQSNSGPIVAQDKVQYCNLTVKIEGVKSDQGTMMVALYNTHEAWLSKAYMGKSSLIEEGKATVTFENLPLGTYGVSTYQDENNNEKLDTGLFGIPKEPYASSRGAKAIFGPPKWKDAKFDLNSESQVELIKY